MRDVPLNKLRFGHDEAAPDGGVNVRRTDRDSGLAELAASIEAHGLIQPLTAVAGGKGVWFVVDGNRRLAAMQSLVKARKMKAADPVPVLVCNDGASAHEIGLAANIIRAPLHEADQYQAFTALAAAGMAEADIASRFGIEARRVRRIMAIGRLSPKVLNAWREGVFQRDAVECVRAFTLAPSIDDQEQVFDSLSASGHFWPHYIRDAFGAGRNDAGRLLTFVGAEAYRAAGGTVIEDLFGTSHVISDPALAKRLADEKLDAECVRLLKEGWSWAKRKDQLPDTASYMWQTLPRGMAATEAERAKVEELEEIVNDESGEREEEANAAAAELERIEAEIEARGWTEDERARSGCMVSVSHQGQLEIRYGMIQPETITPKGTASTSAPAGEHEKKPPTVSAALMQRLSVQMTLAVQKAVTTSPKAGLAALIAGAVSQSGSPIKISLQGYGAPVYAGRDSETFEAAFERLNSMSIDDLLAAAASVAARSIDLQTQNSAYPPSTNAAVTALTGAIDARNLTNEMVEAFDAKDYFGGVAKPLVLRAIEEAVNGDEARKAGAMKKADLVEFAVANVVPTGWLPPEIRHPGYSGPRAARAE